MLSLLNVYLPPPPESDRYRVGDTARVRLTLVNRGPTADALVAVASPIVNKAAVHWDRGCDGIAEEVGRLPVTASGGVPVPPGASQYRHGPYYVQLTALLREALAGTTLPVSFTFERAGTVSVAAKVQSFEPGEAAPAPWDCLAVNPPS
ncbi:copper chaperone PCu(A)C [Amycolatopsis sp. NPDC051903]|uniref:copper chaperone PCu(A)C n=1 Tax=Amycolatopsis sp. NPDC051903 TaxID=3363936 RepID=UPI0037B2DA0B